MKIVAQLRRDAYAPYFTSVGAANLMIAAADEIERLRELAAAYEQMQAQHREHVRRLDVALNGDGAAKQPSLIDLVAQFERTTIER